MSATGQERSGERSGGVPGPPAAAPSRVERLRQLIQVSPELYPDVQERWRAMVLLGVVLMNLSLTPLLVLGLIYATPKAEGQTWVVIPFVMFLIAGLLVLIRWVRRGVPRFGWPTVPALFGLYLYLCLTGDGILEYTVGGQAGGIIYSTLVAGLPGTIASTMLSIGSSLLLGLGAIYGVPWVPVPHVPPRMMETHMVTSVLMPLNLGVALFFFQLLHRRLVTVVEDHARQTAVADERARGQEALAAERDMTLRAFGHEVNNPLTVTRVYLELAKSRLEEAGETPPREIALAVNGVKRIAELTAAISAARAAEMEARRERCDLAALCRRVTQEQEVLLIGRLHVEVPEAPIEAAALNTTRITQVLVNLLGNAAKFSEGPITLSLCRDGDEALIAVRDEGPGIPAEAVPRLFQAFFRANDREGGPPGLGLGLYICRLIVERHGGRIWVAETSPRGTTFCVALPLGEGEGQRGGATGGETGAQA